MDVSISLKYIRIKADGSQVSLLKRSISPKVHWSDNIVSWHLLGHAIKSVTCFDLQFWRSTRPMTSLFSKCFKIQFAWRTFQKRSWLWWRLCQQTGKIKMLGYYHRWKHIDQEKKTLVRRFFLTCMEFIQFKILCFNLILKVHWSDNIVSWHLLGHAIKSITCFDLQFWRSTRPMTSQL
jgi:hypothetical protein